MQQKECVKCGTVFVKKHSTSQKEWDEQSKYCSYKCYWIDKNKEPTKVCPVCKVKFKSRSWSTKAVYCSRKCFFKTLEKPLPKCKVCDKEVKKHARRFCSRECKVIWYQGAEVYGYLGGRAKHIYSSMYWMKIADEIRNRDKVCQRCGKPPKEGTNLHVHHIEPRRVSKDDRHKNLQALCPSCHKKVDHEYQLAIKKEKP